MIIVQLAHKPFGKYRGKLFSPLASIRLRALEVSPALVGLGHRVRLVPFEDAVEAERRETLYDADAYIVHKALFDVSPLLENLQAAGKRVVLDVCDDVLAHPHLRSYYPRLLRQADFVTASSPALAERLAPLARGPVLHVPDCVELTRGEAALPEPSSPLRLLWFGQSANLGPLLGQFERLDALAARRATTLDVVCDVTPELRDALASRPRRLGVELVDWSPEALEAALMRCHFAVLPSSGEAGMATKSANRLQETLWGGRMPVAHRVDSYAPFADAAILTDDIADGIERALADPADTVRRIALGQSLIEQRFTASAVARIWDTAVREASTRPATAIGSRPVRLNLGCGDKLLPGYINVDIAEVRGGSRPDVLCDLRNLSFQPDDSVDEVLAVHVVEHFWRWEIVDTLRDWVRVLKPGGRLILECPNLQTACEAFLRNPAGGSAADERGQETMWVFYGDPSWCDPLMTHRWGYTPDSLGRLMQEAGLVEVRPEPAQFKLRDPRDMRVVGRKPGAGT